MVPFDNRATIVDGVDIASKSKVDGQSIKPDATDAENGAVKSVQPINEYTVLDDF